MTRINVVPVVELTDKHLFAEWRELPRMAGFALKTKSPNIPDDYTLGTGHMKFFLDKGIFLERRHSALTLECIRRGFKLQSYTEFKMPKIYGYKDYTPTENALLINRARIQERLNESRTKQYAKNYQS